MKKVILPFLVIALSMSCGRKNKASETVNILDSLQNKRTIYLELLKQDEDVIYDARCDRLTFKALVSAFGYKQEGISKLEYPVEGRWNRDYIDCYSTDLDGNGKTDSRSTISRDGYISLFHHWLTYQDYATVNRSIEYAEDNYFTVGEGPSDYTNIYPLMPVFYKLRSHLEPYKLEEILPTEDPAFYDKYFEGYRSQLMAMYVYLQARLTGGLTYTEMKALDKLYEQNPTSPIVKALWHRFNGGDQTETIAILNNIEFFPEDSLPIAEDGLGWGKSPRLVPFLVALAIMEGK